MTANRRIGNKSPLMTTILPKRISTDGGISGLVWIFFFLLFLGQLSAQFSPLPGAPDRWVEQDGKIYATGVNVGVGTVTPLRRLHLWGPGHEYARVTSHGGTQFSQSVASLELERRLDNGSNLRWDIVNQGMFKIRRNSSTRFILDHDGAQFGSSSARVPLHIWGKSVFSNNGLPTSGALLIASHNGNPIHTKMMRLDGNSIETDEALEINSISNSNLELIRGGGTIGIDYSAQTNAKVTVASDNFHFRMLNPSANAPEWYMGVSDNSWTVGSGKLVFSKTQYSADALMVLTEQGRVGIGMTTPNRTLDVNGSTRTKILEITGGADLAEPFSVTGQPSIEAGTVVAIDPDHAGQLKIAERAYDRTVAGIISGAGGIQPGMIMGQDGTIAQGEHPVALTGRVYCKVDASYGAIQAGDLLTTSDTPGYAMKVTNPGRAQGAIIGKAMTPLDGGKGLVLVLVSLQ